MTENGPGIAMSKENNLIADSAQVAPPPAAPSFPAVPAGRNALAQARQPQKENSAALIPSADRDLLAAARKKSKRAWIITLGGLSGCVVLLAGALGGLFLIPGTIVPFMPLIVMGSLVGSLSMTMGSLKFYNEGRFADIEIGKLEEKAHSAARQQQQSALPSALAERAGQVFDNALTDGRNLARTPVIPFALSDAGPDTHCLKIAQQRAEVIDFGIKTPATHFSATLHELTADGAAGADLGMPALSRIVVNSGRLKLPGRPAAAMLLPPPKQEVGK